MIFKIACRVFGVEEGAQEGTVTDEEEARQRFLKLWDSGKSGKGSRGGDKDAAGFPLLSYDDFG